MDLTSYFKYMKRYFLKETGEELIIGKPFSLVAVVEGTRIIISTQALSFEDIATLISLNLVSIEESKVPTFDVEALIQHYANRTSNNLEETRKVFDFLFRNSPKALFTILLKEAELFMYEGTLPLEHPGWKGKAWFVDNARGNVISLPIDDLEPEYRKNVAIFRSREDIEFAIKVLEDIAQKAF